MTANPVKQRLLQGERVFGTMVFEFFSPGMPQIAKVAGAEFILFDMEHTALDLAAVKRLVAYCRGIGLPPYVRVPATDYHFIAHALDAGAMGIMVPMVETARAGGVHRVLHALSARGPARAPPSASPTTTTRAATSPPRSPRRTPARWSWR